MSQASILGERVLLARRRAGLTQQQLGALVRLSSNTLARLERGGVQELRSGAIRRLARVLGVTTDYLLGMDVADETTPEQLQLKYTVAV